MDDCTSYTKQHWMKGWNIKSILISLDTQNDESRKRFKGIYGCCGEDAKGEQVSSEKVKKAWIGGQLSSRREWDPTTEIWGFA